MSERKPSIAEPVSDLRRVRIRENGDALVDFRQICPDLRMDSPRFHYRREPYLRRRAAEMLCEANRSLMAQGMRIQIIEGWRAPLIQRRMYAAVWLQFKEKFPERTDTSLRRLVNQFSAPMNSRVPPPHTTGGAMDVALTDLDGNALDMVSPFDRFDHPCFFFDAPGLSGVARRHRDLLAEAMTATGLTNYPSEYWHWSYGDQGWAYRGRHANALYGAVEPAGWSPDPADDTDAALEFVA